MFRQFCIVQRGKSHEVTGTRCQDAGLARAIHMARPGEDTAIGIVADGVGSCPYSDRGSSLAVHCVFRYLERQLAAMPTQDEAFILETLRGAFRFALNCVQARACREENPPEDYATTLSAAILFANGDLYIGHVGDSGIVAVYRDGSYALATRRQKGEFANYTYPLEREDQWEFYRCEKKAASLALMSDGLLNEIVGPEAFYGNRVYLPFLAPALLRAEEDEESFDALRAQTAAYLRSDACRGRISDDMTYIAIRHTEAVAALPKIPFSVEAWNAETRRIAAEIRRRMNESSAPTADEISPEIIEPSDPETKSEGEQI